MAYIKKNIEFALDFQRKEDGYYYPSSSLSIFIFLTTCLKKLSPKNVTINGTTLN